MKLKYSQFVICLKVAQPKLKNVVKKPENMQQLSIVTELSAELIKNNGAPVKFPDFTRDK